MQVSSPPTAGIGSGSLSSKVNTMTKIDVAPAYENAHLVASDLVIRLQEALHSMLTPDSSKLHWGHVGTVSKVNADLAELIQFVESSLPK